MRIAGYIRRSLPQPGKPEDEKSVERQRTEIQAFCDEHKHSLVAVYVDDGVSGALFATRPGWAQMCNDAQSAAFEGVAFSEFDRSGRDSRKTLEAFHALDDLGIELWESTGQRIDLDTFQGRITTTLRAEFAQEYRESISKKVRAAHKHGASQGKPKALVPFGYRNVPDPDDPNPMKKRRIIVRVSEEEPIVRAIYDHFAAGMGLHAIARWLNGSTTRRGCKWNTVTVRRILQNPLYRGELVWGRSTMKYKWPKTKLVVRGPKAGLRREKGQIAAPKENWVSAPRPDLRIVDLKVIARVDARLRESRERYLKSKGFEAIRRAPHKAHGKFLLSGGLLLCPTCGGHFEGRKGGTAWQGRGVYVCSSRKHRPGSCTNRLSLEMDVMDAVVLDQVEGELLSAQVIDQLMRMVEDAPDDNERLIAERDGLQAKKDNLVRSIADGVAPSDVAPLLKEINNKVARIDAALNRPKPVNANKAQLRAALQQRIANWREVLRGEPRVARLLLRQLIEPISLEPQPPVPEWLEQYVGLPEHLRPSRPVDWSQVPGAIPSPGEESTVRWVADTRPGAILEGELSDSSETMV